MYMNSLISLEENMPTYGINGKRVNGHVVISTPGMIKCYVQNLNPLEGKQLILYVFSSKENRGCRIGRLASPEESKETRWRIDEKDVMDSGIVAKDIDAAAIIREGNNMRDTDTVLVGFARNQYRIHSILQGLLPTHHKQPQPMAETTGAPGAPQIPGMPGTPQMPGAPGVPGTPQMPGAPGVPGAPQMPGTPGVPGTPQMPGTPGVPGAPQMLMDEEIDIPEYVTEIPQIPVDEEIDIPEYVTEIPQPQVDEEIDIPGYISELPGEPVDEELLMPGHMHMGQIEEAQDLEEIEIEYDHMNWNENNLDNYDNNNWNNNNNYANNVSHNNIANNYYNTTIPPHTQVAPQSMPHSPYASQGMPHSPYAPQSMPHSPYAPNTIPSDVNGADRREGINYDEKGPKNTIERVLQETYIKQQAYRDFNDTFYNKRSRDEKKTDEETPEEVNYLEEIEKKLKDIQARLKGSEILEQEIKRFQTLEFIDRTEYEDKKNNNTTDTQIEELAKKLAALKSSITASQTQTHGGKSDSGVEVIYRNAPKTQPFEYQADHIDWTKISLSDLANVSGLPRGWETQPFVTFSYYKYNEILLGKEQNTDQYYIGIPDIFHPERKGLLQPEDKVQRFACRKNIAPEIGEYGYWLISL